VAIDIYNNDIHLIVDDFIEAGPRGRLREHPGVHNIRVLRNRGVNAAQCGLSAQPVFGGPAYFIRNVLYHIPVGVALKFMAKPAGLVVYHNTVIAENRNRDPYSNAHFRNNLFLGTDAPGRNISIFPNATSYSSYDYNGYRPNRGASDQHLWASPGPKGGPVGTPAGLRGYKTLQELSAATGQEAHGVELDCDIFENLRAPDPAKPRAVYHAEDLDFRPRPGGKAVDAGVRLPNVNGDFTG
jgi:hypothetical protein